MENLIKKLQEEAGLNEEQAIKSIAVIKDFMDKEGIDIDWDKFFKGKYEDFVDQVKNIYSNVSKQTQEYSDKIVDKFDDIATKAKKGVHDLSKKTTDFFDSKD